MGSPSASHDERNKDGRTECMRDPPSAKALGIMALGSMVLGIPPAGAVIFTGAAEPDISEKKFPVPDHQPKHHQHQCDRYYHVGGLVPV